MPLVFEGRLQKVSPLPIVYERGHTALESLSKRPPQLSLWLSWHTLEAAERAVLTFNDLDPKLFVKLNAQASLRQRERYLEWLSVLQGGSLVINGALAGQTISAQFVLPGERPLRVDEPQHHQPAAFVTLETAALYPLSQALSLPGIHDWPSRGLEREGVTFQPLMRGGQVSGVALHASNGDTRFSLARMLINGLDSVSQLTLQCAGKLEELKPEISSLELVDEPPPRFGLITPHREAPQSLGERLADPIMLQMLEDYGLRWGGFDLRRAGVNEDEPLSHAYFARRERGKFYDQLTLRLALDDLDAPSAQEALAKLATQIGPSVSARAAWRFEVPSLLSAQGRAYSALQTALRELIRPSPSPRIVKPHPITHWFASRFRPPPTLFSDLAQAVLAQALPGFRLDRTAHATDQYLLEFVRDHAYGQERILFRRTFGPLGHRVRLGVSPFNIALADLDVPGAPGLVLELDELFQGGPLWWRYASAAQAKRALQETAALIAGLPVFSQARGVLKTYADAQSKS